MPSQIAMPAISKARFRSGLPGRMTTALSIAIKNSMAGAAMDAALATGAKTIDNRQPDMVGMQKHRERMAQLDPGALEAKAARLGYDDMVVVNQPQIPALTGPLLPAGTEVAVATVEKKKTRGRNAKKKQEVVVATVAPAGAVVPAVAMVAAAAADFPAFVEHWARHTKHKQGSSVYDYLQKQYTKGLVFDAASKRWRQKK